MYTPYGGRKFVNVYFSNRKDFMARIESRLNDNHPAGLESLLSTKRWSTAASEDSGAMIDTLIGLVEKITAGSQTVADVEALGACIHTFEVKKSLIEKSSSDRAPGIWMYLLLALTCCLYYEKYQNLKYLNCLLKLNDLIISIEPEIHSQLMLALAMIVVDREIRFLEQLYQEKVAFK